MRKLLPFLLFILLSNVLRGQIDIPQIVPPSPNSAKLAQFDITPTSPYTGKQNLSIPLYSIDFDGAQFPISINYASGGVRASEEASFVGLGWALSFGGSISRTVKTLNDIRGQGWIYDTQAMPESYNPLVGNQGEIDGVPTTQHPFWFHISSGAQKDTEPDLFNYNFMGYSGTFVLSKGLGSSTTVIKLREDPTKIEFDEVNKTFTVLTPNGFKGEFTVKEWVTSIGGSDPDSQGPKTGCDFGEVDILQIMNDNKRAVTTWYLSKVTSPNGRELNFEYDVKSNGYSNYISESAKSFSEKKSVDGAWQQVTADIQGCSYTIVEHVYPKRIFSTYNGIDINFTKSSRADIAKMANDYLVNFAQKRGESTFTIQDPQRVTGFTVNSTNTLSSLNHTISFAQSYFNPSASNAYQMKRLKLDGVTIDDQVYSFEYENGTNGLPDKSTFGVDYWGFYNGKDQNSSLVPVTIGYTTVTNFYGPSINTYLPNQLFYYQTDDRKADFQYGKAGLLKKVNYPTGGFTEYEYESHEYHLEGKEKIPVTGTKLVTIEGPKNSATTVQSSDFDYNGFIFVGGSCNSSITVNTTIACANFFLGAPDGVCALPFSSGLWNEPAVEIVNAATNQTVFELKFSELGQAINNSTYNVTASQTTNLGPGTYFLKARTVSYNGKFAYGKISVTYPQSCDSSTPATLQQSSFDQVAGGARIKAITNYAGNGKVVSKRSYDYKDHDVGGAFSTGRLMNPLMNFSITNGSIALGTNGTDIFNFHAFMAGSVLSDGGAAQGSHIGYSAVREYFEGSGVGNNGFRDYKFLNEPNLPGYYGLSAKSTYGNTNGQMDDVSNFSATSVKLDKTDYNNHSDEFAGVKAVKIDWLGNGPGIMETYTLKRHFVSPKQTISETYLNGEILTQTTNRTFNGQFLIESETFTNSNGDVILKEYRYPYDIGSPTNDVMGMKSGHFISSVIEQTTKINGVIETASGTAYKQEGTNYLPDRAYALNKDINGFIPTPNGLSFDGGYEQRIQYKLYDDHGNIREFVNEAGISTTILWGYNGVYPVAQIENATYAEVSPLITQATLDNPGSQAALQNVLNTLRQHPSMKNALISTMTFDPGVGMLSQTSPNGITAYYEYDAYGRLKRIKDRDGNILKVVEYGYKQIIPNTQQN